MIVTLGKDWVHAPTWWRSFVTDYRNQNGFDTKFLSTKILNEELEKYHAVKSKDDDGESILWFESEKHFSWFLLKWS